MAGLRPVPTSGVARLGAPARGWPASDLEGLDPAGELVSVPLEGAPRRLLLVFLAVDCDGCDLYWEGLRDDREGGAGRPDTGASPVGASRAGGSGAGGSGAGASRAGGSGAGASGGVCPGGVDPVILTRGPAHTDRASVAGKAAGITRVPVVMGDEAWAHYRVTGYPFFVLVDPGSRTVVGETVGFDWSDVAAMVGAAIDRGSDGG